MRYILTGQQMKEADSYTINTIGVPSLVLMERAALKVVETIEENKTNCSEVLVVCGTGNNGGDGFAIARLLYLKGYKVTVWALGTIEKASEENRTQRSIAENYGIEIVNTFEEKEYSVIIDAIFGTGLAREVKGSYKEAIDRLNEIQAEKVAVDIPSGVSDTSGKVLGTAFRADYTVCLAFEKLGTVMFPGSEYAGMRYVKDIGISEHSIQDEEIMYTYGKEDLKDLLPKRKEDSHKGSFGRVLMITGCKGMSGAAYLSAKAAYATGAGLVQIYTHEDNRIIVQQQLPEAIIKTYDHFDREELKELLDWADVVEIGSGLGLSEISEKIFTFTMQYAKIPCVIDGDGLTILSEDMRLLEYKRQVVLTPHMKEMTRLLQCSMEDLLEDRKLLLEHFVRDFPVVCALKDARTLVAQDGKKMYVNLTGNAAMAKAGSGDVLAGMITGFLAQGMKKKEACELGVLLHGLCGDSARARKGAYSVFASDLINEISEVLKEG